MKKFVKEKVLYSFKMKPNKNKKFTLRLLNDNTKLH